MSQWDKELVSEAKHQDDLFIVTELLHLLPPPPLVMAPADVTSLWQGRKKIVHYLPG
jgi:hypothetical protein